MAMSHANYRGSVEDLLDILIDGLSPFVGRVLAMHVPDGAQWPEVVRRADVAAGHRGGEYRPGDLSLILRAMTERLGTIGFPFARQMSRQAEIYARELREVRDQWARKEAFTAAQALRAMD